jgi:hypothetical protein
VRGVAGVNVCRIHAALFTSFTGNAELRKSVFSVADECRTSSTISLDDDGRIAQNHTMLRGER